MLSIPALLVVKPLRLPLFLHESLRVANGFVTGLAYADQIPLLVSVAVDVVHIQRKIRTALHMVHMVDHYGWPEAALGLADLALMPIFPQDIS